MAVPGFFPVRYMADKAEKKYGMEWSGKFKLDRTNSTSNSLISIKKRNGEKGNLQHADGSEANFQPILYPLRRTQLRKLIVRELQKHNILRKSSFKTIVMMLVKKAYDVDCHKNFS